MKYSIELKQALVSVSDKSNLQQLAGILKEYEVNVVSTGGTYNELSKHLKTNQLQDISQITGFPEILDGRVKTLHPAIHGGILARKDEPSHLKELKEVKEFTKEGIKPFDLVVLNLYPFQQQKKNHTTNSQEDITKMIDFIDIGGITLLRAAAKNYQNVALITSPDDYQALADELRTNDGEISLDFTKKGMVAAFAMSAAYDKAISEYFKQVLNQEVFNSSRLMSAFNKLFSQGFNRLKKMPA